MNSLSFCFSGKLFLLHNFPDRVFLASNFFLSVLRIGHSTLLACRVSIEKFTGSLMGVSLYVTTFSQLLLGFILFL